MATPEQKSSQKANIKKVVLIILGIAIIALIISLLFRGKTTVTTKQTGDDVDVTSLTCKTAALVDGAALIDYRGAMASEHQIEAVFHDDSLYNMSVYSTFIYATADEAEEVAPYMQADLNYYLADHGLETDYYLYETWSVIDNEISLTANVTEDKYSTASAPFFYIDNTENADGTQTAPTSLSALKSNYQKKGFTCTEND